jgi:hypothetical protein
VPFNVYNIFVWFMEALLYLGVNWLKGDYQQSIIYFNHN